MKSGAPGLSYLYSERITHSVVPPRLTEDALVDAGKFGIRGARLLERLERLRQKLKAEGLFDHKKPLPFLPGCIGLVTGKDSDAEKDVLRNAQLRWPAVEFRVVHAAVQGDRAAAEVTAA